MESKPNTDTSNTDPTARIADALEKLVRLHVLQLEETKELRREIRAFATSYNEAHNLI